jgi:hypothetical protein
MQTVEQDDLADQETPTRPDPPSGRWIVAVDRGERLIEGVIARLGGPEPDLATAMKELRQARALVNGDAQ